MLINRMIMKKLLFALFMVVACATQAQYDTLPYNIGIPNYYMKYSFDSMRIIRYDTPHYHCHTPVLNRLEQYLCIRYYEPTIAITARTYAFEGDLAYGLCPDSALNIIGLAWVYLSQSGLFDCWDTIDVKILTPKSNACMMPIVEKKITHDTFSYNKVYDPKRGWSSIVAGWIQREQEMPFYEVYFDNEIGLADTFYVSIKYTCNNSDNYPNWEAYNSEYGNRDLTLGWVETPNTSNDACAKTYPVLKYIKTDMRGEDEPWTYGELNAYPLLFPIIRLEGDTCPEVRNVRFLKAGNTAAIAMWDQGVNHRDWQIYIGPRWSQPIEEEAMTDILPRHVFTGLDPTAHYDVYVRARCQFARDMWSDWTGPIDLCVATIGIDDAEPVEWSLTPNPAHGNATVHCEEGITSVELLTVKGERIMLRDMAGEPTCSLDLSGLAKGIYIVQVTTAQGTAARKLAVE